MAKNKKRKYGFLSGPKSQRFFNFAYSIGAAIVIWGALFKILHLPYGNTLLSIGMGTEVLMFILTAFDRPPREYHWEEVFPVLESGDADDRPDFASGSGVVINGSVASADSSESSQYDDEEPRYNPDSDSDAPEYSDDAQPHHAHVHGVPGNIVIGATVAQQPVGPAVNSNPANVAEATQQYMDQITSLASEMQHLRESTEALNQVSDTLLQSYKAITENSENITRSSTGYVEQMESLNHNIHGLNTIYEIQLKSISSQLDSIDRVNRGIKDIRDMYEKSAAQSARYCEETEKMARYMQQLNSVYEKMITAMTINMYRPMMGANPDINPADATSVDAQPDQSSQS